MTATQPWQGEFHENSTDLVINWEELLEEAKKRNIQTAVICAISITVTFALVMVVAIIPLLIWRSRRKRKFRRFQNENSLVNTISPMNVTEHPMDDQTQFVSSDLPLTPTPLIHPESYTSGAFSNEEISVDTDFIQFRRDYNPNFITCNRLFSWQMNRTMEQIQQIRSDIRFIDPQFIGLDDQWAGGRIRLEENLLVQPIYFNDECYLATCEYGENRNEVTVYTTKRLTPSEIPPREIERILRDEIISDGNKFTLSYKTCQMGSLDSTLFVAFFALTIANQMKPHETAWIPEVRIRSILQRAIIGRDLRGLDEMRRAISFTSLDHTYDAANHAIFQANTTRFATTERGSINGSTARD